ncbi:hypothetical protein DL768_002107 [Monosporascus sp. mg162]|nr:hypothetical protein DL768_002107 [Monosporascus sp. mg162]
MMPSVLGAPVQNGPSPMCSTDFMSDIALQLALSDSMRFVPRGSTCQRPQNAMRVVKPSSASNSPQTRTAHRTTLMNDGSLARRRQQILDYALTQQMQGPPHQYSSYPEPVKRASRPVSWHPGSHPQQPQEQMQMHQPIPQPDYSQYVVPLPTPYAPADIYTGYQHLPPTPTAYSAHASPSPSFSPLSFSFAAPPQTQAPPQYISTRTWDPPHQAGSGQYSTNGSPEAGVSLPPAVGHGYFGQDISNIHAFGGCAAPPTPDDIQPVVPPEEEIPYQPLEDPEEEEEGEILVGMGLYDPPVKAETDPELDNYRTSTSQLLGTTYRRGQGLKLEEAWEPPASDDEDESEDADGEEEEQTKADAAQSTTAQQSWI